MHSAASLEDIASRTPSTQLLSNLIPENSFSFAATPPTILHVKMERQLGQKRIQIRRTQNKGLGLGLPKIISHSLSSPRLVTSLEPHLTH